MDKLIAMQENLGLGHKGNILITTQERVDKNLPALAADIIDEDFAGLITKCCNEYDGLVDGLRKIRKSTEIMEARRFAEAALAGKEGG